MDIIRIAGRNESETVMTSIYKTAIMEGGLVIGEGKKVVSKFLEKSWERGDKTTIKFIWES